MHRVIQSERHKLVPGMRLIADESFSRESRHIARGDEFWVETTTQQDVWFVRTATGRRLRWDRNHDAFYLCPDDMPQSESTPHGP